MLGMRTAISAYERRHRGALLDLVARCHWTHKHLDWTSLERWLDRGDGHFALAWQGDALAGCMALSSANAGVAWIRLVALRDGMLATPLMDDLWRATADRCRELGVKSVMALMLTDWLATYLAQLGFVHIDDLITMTLDDARLPAKPSTPLRVRPAELNDLARIAALDQAVFRPEWQMSASDLRDAWRSGATLTFATLNGEFAGYQMSLRELETGHVARLAVNPILRGRGVGHALLRHALLDMRRRGVARVSVNTQRGNAASQRLYRAFGFERSGLDFEIWNARLAAKATPR